MDSHAVDDAHDKGIEEFQIETLAATRDGQDNISPIDERRVTRKFDLHIMPWLFLMWYASSIQRIVSCPYIHNLTRSLGSSAL